MDLIKIRSLKRGQKNGVKRLGTLIMFFVLLLLASTLCSAEESNEVLIPGDGTIDQIGDDGVVVNDCNFKLSPGVKFYTNSKMNTYANRSRFKKGTKVGFQFKNNGVVTVMWLESK